MKTAATTSPLVTSTNLETSIMGMDAQGMDLATYFMRDKIYSEKKLAVVREYICNAIDEHIKHNIDAPIEVGLRHQGFDKQFYVRDFAKGLDEVAIRNIFGMYFRSTKSNSNENIGGFGVGSKAAHCYTDSFNVVSWHKGKKTTYVCSLGGGDNGVPVGHIVKMDESDDNQSGIEIQVNIHSGDARDFTIYMEKFQAFALHPITLNFYGEKILSKPAAQQKTIDNIVFRLIETSNVPHYERSILLQMGGVCYGQCDLPKGVSVKQKHALAIDVPIGAMTLPISREMFESNKQNSIYKQKVFQAIESLIEEDTSPLKAKKFSDVVQNIVENSGLIKDAFECDWFRLSLPNIYPSCSKFLQNIGAAGKKDAKNLQTKDGKLVAVVLPDAKSRDYWRGKVNQHLIEENVSCLIIGEQFINNQCDILKNEIHFVAAKKLKYKVKAKSDFEFAVYTNGGGSIGAFTVLGFHNRIRSSKELPTASSLEEASQQNKDVLANAETFSDIKLIQINNDRSRSEYRSEYIVKSSKAIAELKKIGIFSGHIPQLDQIISKINLNQERKNEEERLKRTAKTIANKFDLRIKYTNSLDNPKKAERLVNIFNKIKSENSLRGNIILLYTEGYNPPRIERSELRKILKLSCA